MTEELKGRLYLVQRKEGDQVIEESIVEAPSQSRAIAIKAHAMFTAAPAKARDVARVYNALGNQKEE